MPGKERQVEERGDLLTVQAGLEGKVEVIEGLYKRQTRDLQGRVQAPLLLAGDLLFQQDIRASVGNCRIATAPSAALPTAPPCSEAGEGAPGWR